MQRSEIIARHSITQRVHIIPDRSPEFHILLLFECYSKSRWDEWSGTMICWLLGRKEKPLVLIAFSLQLAGIRTWD
jgi:hypothetical protein